MMADPRSKKRKSGGNKKGGNEVSGDSGSADPKIQPRRVTSKSPVSVRSQIKLVSRLKEIESGPATKPLTSKAYRYIFWIDKKKASIR